MKRSRHNRIDNILALIGIALALASYFWIAP